MKREDFSYCDQVTIDEELTSSRINRLVNKELTIQCYHDVNIFPFSKETEEYHGEVMTQAGSVVPNVCSGTIYAEYENKTFSIPSANKQTNKQTNKHIDSAIYLGAIPICWGHYITDGINKLWCLNNESIRSLIIQGTPVLFTPQYVSTSVTPNAYQRVLSYVDSELKVEPITESTHFDTLYVPDSSLYISDQGRVYTKEYSEIIEHLIQSVLDRYSSQKTYDKVYLSRTQLKSKHFELGEKQIQKQFAKQGYKILYPEQLSFEEQVWIYSHVNSIATTMGSLSHNFVFCKPGTDCIILRKAWYTNDFQYVINQVRELAVTYIDCHLSVFTHDNPNLGPFFLYINDNLCRFFKDKFGHVTKNNFSRLSFLRYVEKCIGLPDFYIRRESPKYYYATMCNELKAHSFVIKSILKRLLKR